jgi:hypothetical protein
MPYSTSQKNGKVTVSKKEGGHSKVVGHTTPGKKNAYLAALHIHSKDKDMKKENASANMGTAFDNQVGTVYAVQQPYDGCDTKKLVHKVDPMMGIRDSGIDNDNFYGAYLDEKQAHAIAEKLNKEFLDAAQMLEQKKQDVIEKIKEAIDALENQRTESVNLIKENPKESQQHKEKISRLATKIDDLMNKLEKIENSKKQLKQDKKELKKEKNKK